MCRECSLHADASANRSRSTVVVQKPARKFGRPVGVGSERFDGVGAFDGHDQRRRGRRGADSAKLSSEIAAKIEEAEMKPRRRFDEDGLRIAHAPSRWTAADRTCSVSSAIASSSAAPAVLSTITCSRASSLSTNARSSKCSRVA